MPRPPKLPPANAKPSRRAILLHPDPLLVRGSEGRGKQASSSSGWFFCRRLAIPGIKEKPRQNGPGRYATRPKRTAHLSAQLTLRERDHAHIRREAASGAVEIPRPRKRHPDRLACCSKSGSHSAFPRRSTLPSTSWPPSPEMGGRDPADDPSERVGALIGNAGRDQAVRTPCPTDRKPPSGTTWGLSSCSIWGAR